MSCSRDENEKRYLTIVSYNFFGHKPVVTQLSPRIPCEEWVNSYPTTPIYWLILHSHCIPCEKFPFHIRMLGSCFSIFYYYLLLTALFFLWHVLSPLLLPMLFPLKARRSMHARCPTRLQPKTAFTRFVLDLWWQRRDPKKVATVKFVEDITPRREKTKLKQSIQYLHLLLISLKGS